MPPMQNNSELLYKAAGTLGCEPAALKAVAEVESAGGGFQHDGRPKILFEAHVFASRTGGRYNASHPDISSPAWNRALYRGGPAEWDRLERAAKLDKMAAYASASWGKFQIMGMNYQACGFSDPYEMSQGMRTDAGQTWAFVRFIQSNVRLHNALRAKDWPTFTRIYNGPGQVAHYSAKIADAYAKYRGMPPAPPEAPVADPSAEEKGMLASKTAWLTGGTAVVSGASVASDASSLLDTVNQAASVGYSAQGLIGAFQGVLRSTALPWLLLLAVGAVSAYLWWRYRRKVKAGTATVE